MRSILFRVDFDCDIYITGSNAYLLSSELSTYLSGRYVEIKVLPLSFREFLDFHGYTLTERKSPAGGVKKRVMDADGEIYDARSSLTPMHGSAACHAGRYWIGDRQGLRLLWTACIPAAVVNNILEREKRKGQRTITDAILLRKIIMFLADNIGNNTSADIHWEHAGQRGPAGGWKAKNKASGADDPGVYQSPDRRLFLL